MMRRIITLLIIFCLIFEQAGFSQVVGPLVLPSAMTGSAAADKFRPLHLRSVSLETGTDDLRIILDKGDLKDPNNENIKDPARSLLQYFFVGLSLPNESFWVNLRPDSPDNIIDDHLARTDMGRIMLEADVQLKKDTAKYTSPRSAEGRQYWNKLYQKAEELFGQEDISIPTMTRPWIVPNEIILRQTDNNAYIYKATLQVMLEADYLKNSSGDGLADERLRILNDYSSQLIREMVLPKLIRDVNTSKRYAGLRQVYYSLILAQWFKSIYKNDMDWRIDSKDLTNLVSRAQWDKDTYFKEYRRSFQQGEYNIQENAQTQYGLTIRQYFSGGIKFGVEKSIFSNDMTAVLGNPDIQILSESTLAVKVKIGPDNHFNIENIGTGASRSGDRLSVEVLPPSGAPVSSARDGGEVGRKTETERISSEQLLNESRWLKTMGVELKKAIPAKEKKEEVNKPDKRVLTLLAYARKKKIEDAVLLFKELLKKDIGESGLRDLARCSYDIGRLFAGSVFEDKLSTFCEKRILELKKDQQWGKWDYKVLSIGGVFAGLGRIDKALGVARELTIAGMRKDIFHNCCKFLLEEAKQKGREEEARRGIDLLAKLSRELDLQTDPKIIFSLAGICAQQKDHKRAIAFLKQGTSLAKGDRYQDADFLGLEADCIKDIAETEKSGTQERAYLELLDEILAYEKEMQSFGYEYTRNRYQVHVSRLHLSRSLVSAFQAWGQDEKLKECLSEFAWMEYSVISEYPEYFDQEFTDLARIVEEAFYYFLGRDKIKEACEILKSLEIFLDLTYSSKEIVLKTERRILLDSGKLELLADYLSRAQKETLHKEFSDGFDRFTESAADEEISRIFRVDLKLARFFKGKFHGYKAIDFVKDEEPFKAMGDGLVSLSSAGGKQAGSIFREGLPALKELFTAEEFNRYWPDLVRLGIAAGESAVELFQKSLPALEGSLGKNYLITNWQALVSRTLTVCKKTNKYNRTRIMEILFGQYPQDLKSKAGFDYLKALDFGAAIVEKEPRLATQILEGVLDSVKQEIISLAELESDKEKIFSFISLTRSFSPALFKFYKQQGEQGLSEVFAFASRVLEDKVGEEVLIELEDFLRSWGIADKKIDETVVMSIMVALPSSGASFVKKNEIIGLYRQYRAAGDRREDIPMGLRDKDFGSGKKIALVEPRLKEGQIFDPSGNIARIISCLRYKDGDVEREKKHQAESEDRQKFKEGLRAWLRDYANADKQKETLDLFYSWASHNDMLGEKIDAISGDYNAVALIEPLFTDKDNLSILVREMLKEIGEADFPNKTARVEDGARLAKQLRAIWRAPVPEKRQEILEKFLSRFTREDIESQVLPHIVDEELRAAIEDIFVALPGGTRVSEAEIVARLFDEPYKQILAEKQKFDVQDVGEVELEFRVVKGIPYGLWGLNAGVCIATDLALWQKKEFMLLAMIDKNTKKICGFAHLFIAKEKGRDILTVPGIEPSAEFLSEVKADKVFPLIEQALIKVGQAGGYAGVYAPTAPNTLSNRIDITSIAQKKYAKNKKEIARVNWNTLPSPYPFSEVYEIWTVPAQADGGTKQQLLDWLKTKTTDKIAPSESREAEKFLRSRLSDERMKRLETEYSTIIKEYGYVGFKELYVASGDEAYVLFDSGLPAVRNLFTADEFVKKWPDLVSLGKAANKNRTAAVLFKHGLPAVRKIFTAEEFKEYWPDLVKLGIEAGGNAHGLFDYGLPAVKSLIVDRESLTALGADLISLAVAGKGNAYPLFHTGFPALKRLFTPEEFKAYWPDLVKLGVQAGENGYCLFAYGLPAVKSLITDRNSLNSIGTDLVRFGVETGENARYLFEYGLPAVKSLIIDKNSLNTIGDDLVRMGNASGKQAADLYKSGIPAVEKLFTPEEFREYWPVLAKLGKAVKGSVYELFKYGLPAVRSLIIDENSLNTICSDLISWKEAAKDHAFILFRDSLPAVSKVFTAEELREFWPELVSFGKAKGRNGVYLFSRSIPYVKKLFTTEELKEYWPGLVTLAKATERHADNLFRSGIPALRKIFTPEEFKEYWPDLVKLVVAQGEHGYSVFDTSIPAVRKIFTAEEFKAYWPDLVNLWVAAGRNANHLFERGLPYVKRLIVDKQSLNIIGTDLINLAIAAGENVWGLLDFGIPAVQNLIIDRDSLITIGADLVSLNAAAGKNAHALFWYGLPMVKSMITDRKSLNTIGADLIRLAIEAEESGSSLLQNDLPALQNNLGQEYVAASWQQLVFRISAVCKRTNRYNRARMLELLCRDYSRVISKKPNSNYLAVVDFALEVIDQEKRLAIQVLEGVLEAIKRDILPLSDLEDKRESLFSFIALTHSFSPAVYRLYQQSGEAGLAQIIAFGDKVLQDTVGEKEISKLENFLMSQGIGKDEIDEAIVTAIQMALPSSGASFVKKDEILGLYKRFRRAGDRRNDIPEALRNKDFGNGTKIPLVDYLLKPGEQFDPRGNISKILTGLRYKDVNVAEDAKKEQAAKDKEKFNAALLDWFSDFSNEAQKAKALEVFYSWASHNDMLGEKIDAISGDYNAVALIEPLFTDKDNLSILVREILKEIGESRFPDKTAAVEDAGKLVKQLKGIWKSQPEKRQGRLVNFLSRFSQKDIDTKILSAVNDEELQQAIREVLNTPRSANKVTEGEIVARLFDEPYKQILAEKQKFDVQDVGEVELEFRVVKGIPYGLWGLNAGVCIATDLALWQKKEFMLLAMIDKNTKKICGFAHLFIAKEKGREILTVPGIEPSVEFLSEVKADKVFPLIERALIKVGQAGGYTGVYAPTEANILSNRTDITSIAQKKYAKNKKEIAQVDWNTLPSPYPFSEVYEVWKAPGQNTEEAVQADGGNTAPGGIDLRRLPIYVEQSRVSGASGRNVLEKNPELDDQWQKIQDLVNKGLLPETAMIKEYMQSCRQSNKVPARTDRVLSCIADIFRLEEDCCQATDPALKELLVFLEKN